MRRNKDEQRNNRSKIVRVGAEIVLPIAVGTLAGGLVEAATQDQFFSPTNSTATMLEESAIYNLPTTILTALTIATIGCITDRAVPKCGMVVSTAIGFLSGTASSWLGRETFRAGIGATASSFMSAAINSATTMFTTKATQCIAPENTGERKNLVEKAINV